MEAEDLVQDCYVALLEAVVEFEQPEGTRFRETARVVARRAAAKAVTGPRALLNLNSEPPRRVRRASGHSGAVQFAVDKTFETSVNC